MCLEEKGVHEKWEIIELPWVAFVMKMPVMIYYLPYVTSNIGLYLRLPFKGLTELLKTNKKITKK